MADATPGTVPDDLPTIAEVEALVRTWLGASAAVKPDAGAERLAGVLRDPNGLAFTLGFVDRVMRPEDLRVAARNLEQLSRIVPRFLPWYLRFAVVAGGGLGLLLPGVVIPLARAVLRRMVGHLVIDATPAKLDRTLARLRGEGTRLNINLLGEAVLGDAEADRRLAGTRELLARDDVGYVSIKVSAIASSLSMWGFEETVSRVVDRLLPLYRQAAQAPTPKFINLDMEEYRDLHLTVAVFTRLLDRPELRRLEAGIVLQAYLPDAVAALDALTAWATERVRGGGASIKVRIVKGANLAMERVDAAVHGWPLATWPTKRDTDANYKRMLLRALTTERAVAVRIGVAGHNLFDLAFAWLLASRRGVQGRVEFEMLLGMATEQAAAVRATVGGLLLYTPVVPPAEFDAAISYLVRRLEENASTDNFLSGVFELNTPAIFGRERDRFAASLAIDLDTPAPHRVPQRDAAEPPASPAIFENAADTDPAVGMNREWARGVLSRATSTDLGLATIAAHHVSRRADLEQRVQAARKAGERWGLVPASARAEALDRIGEVIAVFRGRLIEVMIAETGKTFAEADVEVSEAVDFAHWYAARARDLDRIPEARFVPDALTLVTPPWNFPVSIAAGGVLAALAAGSAAVLKPAPQARRCGAVLADAIWESGVSRELLTLIDVAEADLGKALVAAPEVDRIVLTGSSDTAALFHSWVPTRSLLAETSGKNAIIVTPSADLDLAVADIVKSAFGNAGQKCSAASLAILVGSVGTSERFRRQLADATRSVVVGPAFAAASTMGPIIEPVGGKLADALTTLGPGESWVVAPRQLDPSERMWSPGVRDGVAPGSAFHLTEYFGPVLGLMTADTLEEAMALQNAVAYGLTAGIHSLDPSEVGAWLDGVQAGNLYVNRPITGAIVRRQPFGGWKASSVGAGAKAGGPNTLLVLGSWRPLPAEASWDLSLSGLDARVAAFIEACQPALEYSEFDAVRRGALSDQRAWDAEFGIARDDAALGVERNVLRYRPAEVTVRLAEDGTLTDLVRVLAAGVRSRAVVRISSAVPLPAGVLTLMQRGVLGDAVVPFADVRIEPDAAFSAHATAVRPERIRLIGGNPTALARAIAGAPDVAIWANPVTAAGRLELLPFLREQAISITAHRFGNPDPAMLALAL